MLARAGNHSKNICEKPRRNLTIEFNKNPAERKTNKINLCEEFIAVCVGVVGAIVCVCVHLGVRHNVMKKKNYTAYTTNPLTQQLKVRRKVRRWKSFCTR